MVASPDGRTIEEMTELAKVYHSRYARPIAEALIDKIMSVSI
jgi:hypothetical protein